MPNINSYESAKKYLEGGKLKTTRKIPSIRETYVEEYPYGDIVIRHWGTPIIIFSPDGKFIVDTHGWHTATTKERINTFSKISIYQKNFKWFLWDGTPFVDGCVYDADGTPIVTPVLTTALAR